MRRKTVSGIMLSLLLIGMLILTFNIQPIKGWTGGTIYIKADGSVEPDTAPISSVDNITYILTDDIIYNLYEVAIVVERDNIVVDGAGYTIQGTYGATGIDLSDRSNVTIKNTEINKFYYGILLYKSSNISISGNNITDHHRHSIYVWSSSNISISGNIISGGWSGICVEDSSPTIKSNDIIGSYMGVNIIGEFSSPTIVQNIFTYTGQAAINTWEGTSVIMNNLIVGRGVGIRMQRSSPVIVSNTIVKCDCGILMYMHYALPPSSPTVINNIIAYSEYSGIRDIDGDAELTLLHNDLWNPGAVNYDNCVPGIGDISADPMFMDAVAGDYHLQAGSPCIDAGTNEGAPSTDFDGNPRPIDGDSDGIAVVDMGAFEFILPQYTLTIYSSPTGVTFTVDSISHTTPWSGTYSENTSVSLVMPEIHTVGDARYYWNQWNDGNTSRSRTVTMNMDITLTAYYTGPYYQLTVTSSPITGIQFTINGAPKTTPYTEWLLEGSYTLEMPETHNGYVWSHWLEDGDTNRIKTILLQGTTWTAVYEPAPKPVGGKATPINIPTNKPELQIPWIWLTTIILSLVLAGVYVKKRKRNTRTLPYVKC